MVTLSKFSNTVQEEARSSIDKIDKEAGIIFGVKILGSESKNGRTYTEDAMREAATLYEGAKVNLDHPGRTDPKKERAFSDGIGEIRDSHFDKKRDGVFGNLHYLKSHPYAGCFEESAERFPKNFGLSHNADVEGFYDEDNRAVIESITAINSVDVVGTPATNEGLFESTEDTNMKKKIKARKIFESLKTKYGKSILEAEHPDDGSGIGAEAVISPEIEVEVAQEDSSDDKVKAAFEEAIMAAFRDDSLDMKATMEKIKQILKAHEQAKVAMGEPVADDNPSDPPAEDNSSDEVLESLQKKVKRMEAADEVRELMRTEGIEAKPSRVAALVSSPVKFREEMLEEYRKADAPANGSQRPTSSPSKFSSTVSENAAPTSAAEMLKQL